MPIEQPAPNRKRGGGSEQQNRIFNKFEPQGTPRIPGINPPSSRTSGGKDAAGCASDVLKKANSLEFGIDIG